MTATVLLTGFEPFDGDALNPSLEIARALDGAEIAGHRVVGAALPTEFARAPQVLEDLIERHKPALVLALGLAASRGAVLSLERVALNLIDARIADNAGVQPIDVAVVDGAPAAYLAGLPLKAMLARLHAAGIAAALSHSAGTFVCNQVFFTLAHRCAREPALRAGFVHVPCTPELAARHAGAEAMALADMIEGVRLCIDTALTAPADMHFAAGAID